MICDRCKGNKEVIIATHRNYKLFEKCYKCDGSGEMDWLTEILNKHQTKIRDGINFCNPEWYKEYSNLNFTENCRWLEHYKRIRAGVYPYGL